MNSRQWIDGSGPLIAPVAMPKAEKRKRNHSPNGYPGLLINNRCLG